MMEELLGEASFFQVLVLNVTGQLPERRFADWLEGLFICLSYPDARIWCNQIGSLGGTMQTSPVAAVFAGTLASDSRLYGPGTILRAVDFIIQALSHRQQGISVEEIVLRHPKRHPDGAPIIVGYARPVANGDERIQAMDRLSKRLGFSPGSHLLLAFEIDEILATLHGERINLVGYTAAFLTDLGYAPSIIYRLLSCWVISGVHACYAEAANQPPGSFFPLHCADIDYQGKPPRVVPT
jgi:citrate synthase